MNKIKKILAGFTITMIVFAIIGKKSNPLDTEPTPIKDSRIYYHNKNILKNPQNEDPSLPIVSVILTISSGSRYDDLFTRVPQVPPRGRTVVYHVHPAYVDVIVSLLKGGQLVERDYDEKIFKLLMEIDHDIKLLEGGSVLFNWECCSEFSGHSFGDNQMIKNIKYLIDRGYMTMFSDFAVKALIQEWDEKYLGKNPFVKLNECSGTIDLGFDPEQLKAAPSSQLNIVGSLSEKGTARISAMSGTIVFSVNPDRYVKPNYNLTLLSVVTNLDIEENYKVKIKEFKGSVGHAMITYPSGGIMLLSAGHWISLLNLDVSYEKLKSFTNDYYGEKYSVELEEMSSLSKEKQEERVREFSSQLVLQNSAAKYKEKDD